MTPHDLDRASALAKIFTAQELDYITDWIMASEHTSDTHRNRLEYLLWEAHGMAVKSQDSIRPE